MKASLTRRRLTAGTLVLGATLVALGLTGSPASSAEVTPDPFVGNQDCADLGYDFEFKIQGWPDEPGTPPEDDYTVDTPGSEFKAEDESDPPAGLTITISNVVVDDVGPDKSVTFDWAAVTGEGDLLINAVIVKTGNGGNLYDYGAPGFSEDTGLMSDKDSISHISFCWGGAEPQEEETTTTEAAPTTTEDSDVEGDVIAKDEVAPAQLPRTGDNDRALFLIGMGFITIGAVSMIARRQLYIRS